MEQTPPDLLSSAGTMIGIIIGNRRDIPAIPEPEIHRSLRVLPRTEFTALLPGPNVAKWWSAFD